MKATQRTGSPKRARRQKKPEGPAGVPATALEEKQALLAHHVRMVARRMSFGLFVAGAGGLGKTKVISETLAAEGVAPVLANSHVTPLALYETLYRHRLDRVIWLDDADSMYANQAVLGLLRSALWGTPEGRFVTYSSTKLQGVPGNFEFDSRFIFTANSIPRRNEAFKAVLSRVDTFELAATNDEILELMRATACKGFATLTASACLEVVDFIERSGGSRQLSMRLFESSMRKVEYALQNGTDWRDLVRSQLDQFGDKQGVPRPLDTKRHDIRCMALAVEKYPASAKRQEEFWRETTDKSRASFFRVKRDYEARQRDGGQ